MRVFIALILIGVASSGCGKDSQEQAQNDMAAASAKAASAQQEADQKIAAAKADEQAAATKAAQDRATAKATLQSAQDGMDRKLTYLKDKASKLTGTKKSDAARAQADVEAKRDAVKADMQKLDATSGSSWIRRELPSTATRPLFRHPWTGSKRWSPAKPRTDEERISKCPSSSMTQKNSATSISKTWPVCRMN